ncbi:MAG: serine hydrolase domain-containing protein [Gemmatimonadota bacterium]
MLRSRALISLLAWIPVAVSAQQPSPTAGFDQVFQQWNSTTTPGCAVGVGRPGQPVLTRAYGMANLEFDIPNTPETIFEAGSVSKQFTAAAIVLLSLDGKLSLDDDVRKYIPELPDYKTPVRIRHMLTHTSGLRDWGSVAGITGWPRGRRAHTHAHVVDILSRQRALNFPPGAEYSYSNSGYNLLAVVVDRVSGLSFAEFSKKRLFEPLGMTHTQWRNDFTRIVKNRSVGYSSGRQGGAWSNDMPFENVHGNGGLLTTVGDLLIWNENLNTGKLGGRAFLDAMHKRGVLTSGREIFYASGLQHGEHNGKPTVTHTGSTAGYRAFLGRQENNLSIAVLCNAGNANPGTIGNQIAAIFLGPQSRPVAQTKAAGVAATALESKAGMYREWRTNELLRLTVTDGKLQIAGGARPTELVPTSNSEFEAVNRRFVFVGAGGNRSRIVETNPTADSIVYYPTAEFAPSAVQLAEFAGEYYSPDLETTLTVVVENGRLALKRRPDTRIALTPLYTDAFNSSLGVIRFHRDTNGRITELGISQGRVYDLRATRQSR